MTDRFDELIERSSLGTPQAKRLRKMGHDMSTPFSAEEMAAEAMGAMTEWVGGWTEPEDDRPQRRIRIETIEGWYIDVRVEGERYAGEPDRHFRIYAPRVEELP